MDFQVGDRVTYHDEEYGIYLDGTIVDLDEQHEKVLLNLDEGIVFCVELLGGGIKEQRFHRLWAQPQNLYPCIETVDEDYDICVSENELFSILEADLAVSDQ